jgi:hypothetical protein
VVKDSNTSRPSRTRRLKFLMNGIIEKFSPQFARMQNQHERKQLLEQILVANWNPNASDQKGAAPVPRDHDIHPDNVKLIEALSALADKYDLHGALMAICADKMTNGIYLDEDSWTGPCLFLPCANANIRLHKKCPNAGVQACGGCRLVSYCSTVRFLT